MTTTVTSTIRNGVDSATMYATLDAIKAQPELANFQFRVRNTWLGGAHNRTSIKDFYAAGRGGHQPLGVLIVDAGEPPILLGHNEGPNPGRVLLAGAGRVCDHLAGVRRHRPQGQPDLGELRAGGRHERAGRPRHFPGLPQRCATSRPRSGSCPRRCGGTTRSCAMVSRWPARAAGTWRPVSPTRPSRGWRPSAGPDPWRRSGSPRASCGLLQHIGPAAAALGEHAVLHGGAEMAIGPLRAARALAVAVGAVPLVAELDYWLGRLGEGDGPPSSDAAEPYLLLQAGEWRAAARIWEDLGFPYQRARTLAEADDGDALCTALEIAERLDAAPLAARSARGCARWA